MRVSYRVSYQRYLRDCPVFISRSVKSSESPVFSLMLRQMSRPGSLQRRIDVKMSLLVSSKRESKMLNSWLRGNSIWPSWTIPTNDKSTNWRHCRAERRRRGKWCSLLVLALDQSITPLFFRPLCLLFTPAGCRGRCGLRIVLHSLQSSEHVLFWARPPSAALPFIRSALDTPLGLALRRR